MKPIKIPHHTLGVGHPCFVIAEMSANHNKNMMRVKEKFQEKFNTIIAYA
jgi:sialic acid synthase SpsE